VRVVARAQSCPRSCSSLTCCCACAARKQLDIRRQRRYLRQTLHPSYGGLEALEYPSQWVGLLADEGTPLQVPVSPRDLILEVKHILEHDRLFCGVCVCALPQHHDQDITLQRHDWERNALYE
jgi:hypothetical protein